MAHSRTFYRYGPYFGAVGTVKLSFAYIFVLSAYIMELQTCHSEAANATQLVNKLLTADSLASEMSRCKTSELYI